MWYCLCWKVYHCHPTCTKAKLAQCLAGEPVLHIFVSLSRPHTSALSILWFWVLYWCLLHIFFLMLQTDMVYELLRTSTEYVTNLMSFLLLIWCTCHFVTNISLLKYEVEQRVFSLCSSASLEFLIKSVSLIDDAIFWSRYKINHWVWNSEY